MKKWLLSLPVMALLALTAPAHAVTIDVFASSAPNAFGSPSFTPWMANTQCFLQGTCSEGNRNVSPEAFETLTTFEPGDAMVTNFNSWRGQADPGTVFGPAFGSELGNRMHFPVHFQADNAADTFTLGDITFDISSNDSNVSGFGGSGALGFSGDLSGTTFNGTSRVGINWGGDGAKGGGDDVFFASGEADGNLVHELFYVGVGNALWPQIPDHGATPEEAFATILVDFFLHPTDPVSEVTTTYCVENDCGFKTVASEDSDNEVPEPGALALFGIGLAGLGAMRRRRR